GTDERNGSCCDAVAAWISQAAVKPFFFRRGMTQGSGTERAFLDLSARAKFRVTGADRSRFLNGQITNDLRKSSETAAIEACVLNAKGKTDAHIFLSVSGDCFLVDTEPDLRERLKSRLERYVIADDVEIEDM